MYKAGDFTNGKMNDIFSMAYSDGAVDISHKQFGQFKLIGKAENTHYLLTVLELNYGIIYEEIKGGFLLKSLLSTPDFAIGVGTDHQMNADHFTSSRLLAGLFFLSDKLHKPVGDEDFVAQTLMRIALHSGSLLSVTSIYNCNKKQIAKSTASRNNSLCEKKIVEFLDQGIGTNKPRIHLAICNAVIELATNSIQYNVIEGDNEDRECWNMLKTCLTYFEVKDRLGDEVNQESFAVCLEHLAQEGVINYISEDEFEINITSSTI